MNDKARAFERDTFLEAELRRIIAEHGVQAVCETGSEFGGSANAFIKMPPVKEVVTIDLTRKFGPDDLLPGVTFMEGDSRLLLASAIMRLEVRKLEPILFFLDAHTSIATDVGPLAEELKAIGFMFLYSSVLPIIVIHDCRVPGRDDLGFDTYKDGPICLEAVAPILASIYPHGYQTAYNTQAAGSKRGCLFVTPKTVVMRPYGLKVGAK